MSDYSSTTTFEQMAQRITSAQRVCLTTHAKPDGDGLGAALAMYRALDERGGPQADIFVMGPVESRLEEIAGSTPYRRFEDAAPDDDYDLIVVLDTGAWTQLEPMAEWLRRHRDRVVGIDHHAKGDDVAPMRLVDSTAASTTQLLIPLLDAMGCPITGGRASVAEALFIGLATDTGWFRYQSAGAETLRLAARLLDAGVEKTRLFELIEETFRPERLRLAARALGSIEYHHDNAVAILMIRPHDLADTGGRVEDLSEFVNMPLAIRVVRVSIMLAEVEPGRTKISLRSKPDPDGGPTPLRLDVNRLAQRFGGGGHTHASGALSLTSAEQTRDAVVAALAETWAEAVTK